jgi:hypothetical protein
VLTHHELVVSDFILKELGRKLRDKFHFPQNEIHQLQRLLGKVATSVAPLDLPTSICRDPTDIPVHAPRGCVAPCRLCPQGREAALGVLAAIAVLVAL